MLEKPALTDEAICACLRAEYGLLIDQIAFLPLGGDLNTAVYQAAAEDGTVYFCKLRGGPLDEISVELPKFLSDLGIPQVIPPLLTRAGHISAELEPFNLTLSPFIEGTSGFELELTQPQWADFGFALQRIHAAVLPPALSRKIRTDRFSSEWRTACRSFLQRLDSETLVDPVVAAQDAYLRPRRQTVLDLLGYAEHFAGLLVSRPLEFVLCHSDIHPGNLFIDRNGWLFIVDWDDPMLAPKERDLMFIGGGQGFVGVTAQEEESFFYSHYSTAPFDPILMAYYRCERNITDIAVECSRIFSSTLGDLDRRRSLEIITWLFLPGSSIEMALSAVSQAH